MIKALIILACIIVISVSLAFIATCVLAWKVIKKMLEDES